MDLVYFSYNMKIYVDTSVFGGCLKKFDAVKLMRDIRDKLVKRYLEDPELEKKDLEDIRKKYGLKPKKSKTKM
jgi:hypothetical protein